MAINKKLIIPLLALIITAITLTAVTAALLSTQQNIPSSGTIQPTTDTQNGNDGDTINTINVDIYTDASTTTKLTEIQWGTINAGATITKTIYIKNSGNTAETLNMTASGWSPTNASSVLTLSWNKEGSILATGEIVPATLTLQVAENTESVTGFNVNIIITGTA